MKYLCDPHIIPTVVPDNFSHLERFVESASYALEIHIDVADGVFAPNTTWPLGPGQDGEWSRLEALFRSAGKKVGVHLMTGSPREHGDMVARTGSSVVVGHLEAFASESDAHAALLSWRKSGAQEVGLALLIDTPLERIDEFAGECDLVHLMSIARIGKQGIPYDDRVLQRIEELHARYPDMMVQVDGGVSESNIEDLVRAGANRLCVGSAISNSADPAAAFATLHARAMKGCEPQRAEAVSS